MSECLYIWQKFELLKVNIKTWKALYVRKNVIKVNRNFVIILDSAIKKVNILSPMDLILLCVRVSIVHKYIKTCNLTSRKYLSSMFCLFYVWLCVFVKCFFFFINFSNKFYVGYRMLINFWKKKPLLVYSFCWMFFRYVVWAYHSPHYYTILWVFMF